MVQIHEIPPSFIQLCIKHEYFKRNTAMEAHENVCDMINSERTKEMDSMFPKTKQEFPDVEHMVSPAKKMRRKEDEPGPSRRQDPPPPMPDVDAPEAAPPPPTQTLDRDSDDDEIDEPAETAERDEYPANTLCTLSRTKWLYGKSSWKELAEIYHKKVGLNGDEIRGILAIRRICKCRIADTIARRNYMIKVTAGYRRMSIKTHNENSTSPTFIHYMSSKEGCVIWYGDTAKIDRRWKYQSLAANDFSYLVIHPETKLQELEMDVEEYRSCDSPIYPFDNFYRKFQKYMIAAKIWINVKKFVMKLFMHREKTENGQNVFGRIWKYMDPGVLKSVQLRVWDSSKVREEQGLQGPDNVEFLGVFYESEQWMGLKNVDIMDKKLFVEKENLKSLFHLKTIRMIYTLEYFEATLDDFSKDKQMKKCKVYVNDSFNFSDLFDVLITTEGSQFQYDGSTKRFNLSDKTTVTLAGKKKKIAFETRCCMNDGSIGEIDLPAMLQNNEANIPIIELEHVLDVEFGQPDDAPEPEVVNVMPLIPVHLRQFYFYHFDEIVCRECENLIRGGCEIHEMMEHPNRIH